jgi:hypothetical protein
VTGIFYYFDCESEA